MNKPPDRTTKDAGRRRPEYVIELSVSPELRERARRAGAAWAPTRQSARRQAAEPGLDPRPADREAEP